MSVGEPLGMWILSCRREVVAIVGPDFAIFADADGRVNASTHARTLCTCAIAELHDLHMISKVVNTSGAAYAVGFTAMASCSSRLEERRLRDWSGKITVPAFHRPLATVPGNAASRDLPVDMESSKVAAMLEKTHVGFSAPPGSGLPNQQLCRHCLASISTQIVNGASPSRSVLFEIEGKDCAHTGCHQAKAWYYRKFCCSGHHTWTERC